MQPIEPSSSEVRALATNMGLNCTIGQMTNRLIGLVQGLSLNKFNLIDSSFVYIESYLFLVVGH
jgi:hypothetical protein